MLRIGQRHRLAAVDPGDRQLPIALARCLDQAYLLDEGTQFAGFEQTAQGQLDIAGLAYPRNDLRGQQRVPAEGEKVVAQAYLRLAEDFTPNGGDLLLQFGHRLDMFALLPLRLGQGSPLEFAGGTQGHGVET